MKRNTLAKLFIPVFLISILGGCTKENQINAKQNTVNIVAENNNKEKSNLLREDDFIKKNHSPINLSNYDAAELTFLDEDLKNHDVFLAGEGNFHVSNVPLKIKLFKYFVENAGVKYYIPQLSASEGWLYNKYLETGDEELKEYSFYWIDSVRKVMSTNTEWKEMKKYYSSLPEAKKFKVIGLDMELDLVDPLKCLNLMISEKENIESIPLLQELKNNIENNAFNDDSISKDNPIYKFALRIKEDLDNNVDIYEKVLEDDFIHFKFINEGMISLVDGTVKGKDESHPFSRGIVGEKQLSENLSYAYEYLPKGKFFGQWATSRATLRKLKCQGFSFDNFAYVLNESDSKLKNKVFSINYNDIGQQLSIYSELEPYTEKDEKVVLFKLSGEDSPFNNMKAKDVFSHYDEENENIPISEYFDAWVIIKDSKKTTDPNYVSGRETIEEKWLEKNYSNLHIENDDEFSTFNILKEDLENNEVFLTGESHGVGVNDSLDLKFLKFFQKEAGIKYYLQENSICGSMLLNEYLKTGNKLILDRLFISSCGLNTSYTKENYNKWEKIYEFNKELPDDDKIKVIGLDAYGDPDVYFMCLNRIIDKHNSTSDTIMKEFKDIYEEYVEMNNDPKLYDYTKVSEMLEESFSELRSNIDANKEAYKVHFDEDFDNFLYLIDNFYYNSHICNLGSEKALKYRDEKMYENFKRIHSTLPKGKYYGRYGDSHILKQGFHLAEVMDKDNDSPVKGKVLSIYNDYLNCCTSFKGYRTTRITSFNEEFFSLIEPYRKSNNVLFKLNGEKSPFNEIELSKYLPIDNFKKEAIVYNDQVQNSITDYFDYILVSYDSKENIIYKNFKNSEEYNKYADEIFEKFSSLVSK